MVWARGAAAGVLIALLALTIPANAGHESPFYPSYYPQEIRLESIDATAAGGFLQRGAIHAFIGDDPFPGRPLPVDMAAVDSLGSYVVVTLNPSSARFRDQPARCALARYIVITLARDQGRFVFHPYPVTPYHMDYLEHVDLAELSRQQIRAHTSNNAAPGGVAVTVSAHGPLAEDLVKTSWTPQGTGWDARVETVDAADLLRAHAIDFAGWVGPPWLKEGWFGAYLLLADWVADRRVKEQVDQLYQRLVSGDYQRVEDRIALARTLVKQLTQGCEKVLVGYTVRRTSFSTAYSPGIENVGYDSVFGLASPIFVRTAKLKDFPWNGRLHIGVAGAATAAWNPIGGFQDPFGRMVWAAVGDPALLSGPSNGGWIPNRVTFRLVQDDSWFTRLRRFLHMPAGASHGVEVPPDAVLPQHGSGHLRQVGPGKRAMARVEYRVLASAFHDGTQMTAADVLYAMIFAYRWTASRGQDTLAYDPSVEAATTSARQHLVGIRVLRTETVVKNLLPDLQLRYDVLVLDVYVNANPLDPEQAAATAPPWSTVPWHLMALMEATVAGGGAAFSSAAAAHRGVPWLDLVRVEGTKEQLARRLDDFKRRSYIPDALKGLVTPEEAHQRWTALEEFSRNHHHFLVTNGPYRLAHWSDHGAVLEVFRNLSYPLGVGSFDRYVRPHRAYITQVAIQGDRLVAQAEVERVIKFERTYRIARERLGSNSSGAIDDVSPVCRYLVVHDDGLVVKDATAGYGSDGVFTADLRDLGTGAYTVLVAIYLNENYMNPDVRVVRYRKN